MERLLILATETLGSIMKSASDEKSTLRIMLYKLISHPIKLIAAYIFSPILMFKIIRQSDNPTRRRIAIFGLVFALICAYIAGTMLGTLVGFSFIAANVGIFTAIGFIIGTAMSLTLSIAFSIMVFNFITFVFLKINRQEVIEYLNEISE